MESFWVDSLWNAEELIWLMRLGRVGGGVEVRYQDRDGDADDRTTRLQRLALALLLKETQAPCSYDTAAEAGRRRSRAPNADCLKVVAIFKLFLQRTTQSTLSWLIIRELHLQDACLYAQWAHAKSRKYYAVFRKRINIPLDFLIKIARRSK